MATTIPAQIARTHLGSEKKARFVITKSGKPAAVLLSVSDFDDMLEELDPEFQESLQVAKREYRAGKTVPIREYLKQRATHRRAG